MRARGLKWVVLDFMAVDFLKFWLVGFVRPFGAVCGGCRSYPVLRLPRLFLRHGGNLFRHPRPPILLRGVFTHRDDPANHSAQTTTEFRNEFDAKKAG